jgi:hypothetical protein
MPICADDPRVTAASWGPVLALVTMVLAGSVEVALLGTAQAIEE